MQVVEQTIINKDDPRYKTIDAASFAAKNLYNLATYEVRQSFIIEGMYLDYGEVNNQHFVQIPHARFIDMMRYKGKLAGVEVRVQQESYTSKASALDLDPIPNYDPKRTKKPVFSGKREKRGLYRAKNGRRINADVNGSYNIGRKAVPNSERHGIEAHAVCACAVACSHGSAKGAD